MDYWPLPGGVIGYPFVVGSKEKLQLHFHIAHAIHFQLSGLYRANVALPQNVSKKKNKKVNARWLHQANSSVMTV